MILATTFLAFAEESEFGYPFKSKKTEQYIHTVYDQIRFDKNHKLSLQAFQQGFYGYLNMKESGKISSNALLTICDYSLSSNVKRMWVIDINNRKVLFNTLVAHGMASGEEFATSFSNIEESHQSSLGFYTTGETYFGDNGYSLKLIGEDGKFNNKAYERAIVIHAAPYVCDEFAKANQRLGRSHGCPALPSDIAPKIIDKIKDRNCVFIYAPVKEYLAASYWLKKPLLCLPQEAEQMEVLANVKVKNPSTIKNAPELLSDKLAKRDKMLANTATNSILDESEVSTSKPEHAKITSIIIVNKNERAGTSDTLRVK